MLNLPAFSPGKCDDALQKQTHSVGAIFTTPDASPRSSDVIAPDTILSVFRTPQSALAMLIAFFLLHLSQERRRTNGTFHFKFQLQKVLRLASPPYIKSQLEFCRQLSSNSCLSQLNRISFAFRTRHCMIFIALSEHCVAEAPRHLSIQRSTFIIHFVWPCVCYVFVTASAARM